MAELVDAPDSKSGTGNCVWVQFPPPAFQFLVHWLRVFRAYSWAKYRVKMISKAFRVILVASLFCAGCSNSAPTPAPADFKVSSAELFLARSNLNDVDFEQYKVDGNKLFVECGKILRGRYIPQQQQVFSVTPTELESLNQCAWQVSRYKSESYDKPGDNSSMIDPGQAYLSLGSSEGSFQIKTSLDAVSAQTTLGDTAMYGIASNLRALAGGKLCTLQSFYGVR